MLCNHKNWIVPCLVRKLGTTRCNHGNHYDALGLTPKANQTEIKSAYYKLSMLYHPDKSKGEASANKFKAINEAYEVLGNVRLKKLYDKGLIVGRDNTSGLNYKPEPEPTDPTLRFYKSRQKQNIISTMDGKTPIYDFDTWSKRHYGETLKKKIKDTKMTQMKQKKMVDSQLASNQEMILFVCLLSVTMFAMLIVTGQPDYDTDQIAKRRETNTGEQNQ